MRWLMAIGALCPLMLLAVGLPTSGCQQASAIVEERVIFSSNRGTAAGRHLWSIVPSGAVSSLRQSTFGENADRSPRVSPDGTLVAFTRTQAAGSSYVSIWVRSLATGVETRITDDASANDSAPFWSPSGNLLGFIRAGVSATGDGGTANPRLWIVSLVRQSGSVRAGRPARVADARANRGDWNPVTGADILFQKEESEGWSPYSIARLAYPAATTSLLIPYDGRGYYNPAYSPDGLRIAFVRYRRELDLGELYVANADGSHQTLVACEHGWGAPAWSPDATELVAARTTAQGLWRLAVPEPDGPCSAGVQLTRGAFQDDSPAWAIVDMRR